MNENDIGHGALVSIITPVYNPPVESLLRCIESVVDQTSTNWEWCIADNGSTDPGVVEALESIETRYSNVHIAFLGKNLGIAEGSNAALRLANGEFVALLDHDDELAPDAVATFEEVLTDIGPSLDYAYSDEEIVDETGLRVALMDKPAWSPTRLRSQMYCGHLAFIRRQLVSDVGGFDAAFDGSQDYDLVLRVTEHARRIVHIPRVLYRWRAGPDSAALDPNGKPWAYIAGIRAVQAHCDRVGIEATVEPTDIVGVHRLRRTLPTAPLISIIIPTAGSVGHVWGHQALMIDRCLQSILTASTYPNFEIICIVDRRWRGHDSVEILMDKYQSTAVRFLTDSGAFNFSRKINLGVFHARGDRLVFLNDDTEIITPDWLEAMLGVINEGDVGAVGAALLHPDGTLQHGGQYMNQMPHHILYNFPFSEPGPMSCVHLERECAGITAACEMVRRDVFESVGGFCEQLSNNYNDVDFSLKVREMGMRVVWTPWARLWHHESTSRLIATREDDHSRSNAVQAHEHEFMRVRWREVLTSDPYVSDSLRVDHDTPITFPIWR